MTTIESPEINESVSETLSQLCLDEARDLRRLLVKGKKTETEPYGLEDYIGESADGVTQTGWVARLMSQYDKVAWIDGKSWLRKEAHKPDPPAEERPVEIVKVYLNCQGKVVGSTFQYGVSPEEQRITGLVQYLVGEGRKQELGEDDTAHLRVLLQDAITSTGQK